MTGRFIRSACPLGFYRQQILMASLPAEHEIDAFIRDMDAAMSVHWKNDAVIQVLHRLPGEKQRQRTDGQNLRSLILLEEALCPQPAYRVPDRLRKRSAAEAKFSFCL